MGKACVLIVLLTLGGWSCSGGGGVGSGDALTLDECHQLLDKIDEVMYSDLTESERAEVTETESERAQSAQECVDDRIWDRKGLECVLEADSESDLQRCVLGLG